MDGFTIIGFCLFGFILVVGLQPGTWQIICQPVLYPILTSRRVKRLWNKPWPAFSKVKKPLRDILPAFPNLGPPFPNLVK